MKHDRDAAFGGHLVHGSEILSCTFATMDMLRLALATVFGADDAYDYGLVLVHTDDSLGTGGDTARPRE